MNFWVIRSIAVATIFFAPALRLDAAKPAQKAAAADVQKLADFPALQRLAAKSEGKVIRDFLREVSSEYRSAGYEAFAQALPKADSLLALFGNPEAAEDAGNLRKARATSRHLQSALAKNPRIALPRTTGESIPNYFGIATTFNHNASRALKNLAAGKNVANFLRKKIAPSEITKIDESQYTFSGTVFSVDPSNELTFTSVGAGAIDVNASSTLTSGSGAINGALTLSPVLANVAGYRWIAFPPTEEVPVDWTGIRSTVTLSSDVIVGTLTLAGGTRLAQAPAEYPIPPRAVEVPAGTTLTFATTLTGSFPGGTLSIPPPSPTPTPAE